MTLPKKYIDIESTMPLNLDYEIDYTQPTIIQNDVPFVTNQLGLLLVGSENPDTHAIDTKTFIINGEYVSYNSFNRLALVIPKGVEIISGYTIVFYPIHEITNQDTFTVGTLPKKYIDTDNKRATLFNNVTIKNTYYGIGGMGSSDTYVFQKLYTFGYGYAMLHMPSYRENKLVRMVNISAQPNTTSLHSSFHISNDSGYKGTLYTPFMTGDTTYAVISSGVISGTDFCAYTLTFRCSPISLPQSTFKKKNIDYLDTITTTLNTPFPGMYAYPSTYVLDSMGAGKINKSNLYRASWFSAQGMPELAFSDYYYRTFTPLQNMWYSYGRYVLDNNATDHGITLIGYEDSDNHIRVITGTRCPTNESLHIRTITIPVKAGQKYYILKSHSSAILSDSFDSWNIFYTYRKQTFTI